MRGFWLVDGIVDGNIKIVVGRCLFLKYSGFIVNYIPTLKRGRMSTGEYLLPPSTVNLPLRLKVL